MASSKHYQILKHLIMQYNFDMTICLSVSDYIVGVLQGSWHLKTKQLEAVAQKCSVK